ncbi:hypothetical protein ACIQU4_04920 [Streptomyces sp. NPDC090741]|uniref:hypothetical protein n=1 Tax=Streptomyces sp. NPDC090741 TaxID=3365967 RepID=UPI00380A2121
MRGTAPAAALGAVAVLGIQGMAGGAELAAPGGGGTAKAYSAGAKEAGPVEGEVHKLALQPKGAGEAVLSQRGTQPFGLLGVSWTDPAAEVKGTVEARARDAKTGAWSKWIALDPVKPGMDGVRPGAHGSTEPVWVGASDGAEVRISGGGALPTELKPVGDVVKVRGRMWVEPGKEGGQANVLADYTFVYPLVKAKPGAEQVERSIVRREITFSIADPRKWQATAGKIWLEKMNVDLSNSACDVYDGFLHPVFDEDRQAGPAPSGTPVDPYDRSRTIDSGDRQGCGSLSRT